MYETVPFLTDELHPPTTKLVTQRLISVSCPCPDLDPMAVFQSGQGQPRFYWADRESRVTYVGLGIAADLQAWGADRVRSITNQTANLYDNAFFDAASVEPMPAFAEPQLFGGFAFSNDFTPDNTWSVYHPAQFILPHYQLAFASNEDGRPLVWLTMNTLTDANEDAVSIASQLKEGLITQATRLRELESDIREDSRLVNSINYPMSFEQWKQILNAALNEFEAGRLEKVVLSRVCEIRFRDSVDVNRALAFLNANYPDCHRFIFEPLAHHAFFGASPETLVQLVGRSVNTMGLAGSAPRGKTLTEDVSFGQGLLDSAKNQHEHAVVVDEIRRRLAPICTELVVPNEPELLKLSNIHHLYTPVQGQLKTNQTIFDLVELLHPTPALGGAPRTEALTFIDSYEPVPRGWYAAPVGLVNRHLSGTFCVAIRSAVAEYERIWLHAGAGIVAGSDPQLEWDETALKFRPILNALGVQVTM